VANAIRSSHSYDGYNVHIIIPSLSAWWYLILQWPLLCRGPQILQTIFLSDTLQRSSIFVEGSCFCSVQVDESN